MKKTIKRTSGVLMHISTLWGDYSHGSFGEAAKQFIDFLCDCGFTYWQVLPFGVTDDCNSPYKSYSAFAGNPYFIDIEKLYKEGLVTEEELSFNKQKSPYVCEFDFLKENRLNLLMNASKRLDGNQKNEVEKFIESNLQIKDFCVFMTNRSEGNKESTLFMWKFIQYEFFKQWFEIKKYANSKGIYIIGDIPIYVSSDSSDVYFNKNLFDIDKNGNFKSVAGVPPDYFSEDGQLWGNPIYNWRLMSKDGFSWWQERMKFNLKIFDGVRIDHFRGFESYWSIPASASSAKEGKWVKGGGKKLIDSLKAVTGDSLIIAEDLGDITPKVTELVNYSGFLGIRVFQFAFLGDCNSPHLPHNYPDNCVAYTGTHDNNTLLGYIWETDESTRRRIFDYCGYNGNDRSEGCKYIIKTVLESHASTVIFPIQDILCYGSDTRMNTPGKAKGNWQIRFTFDQINSIDRKYIKYLNELYSRI